MGEPKIKTINLNASEVEACRICLATDVKLNSLQDTHLGTCMKSIAALTESFEGLPNSVCYECAPVLLKCNKLLEKSKTAQDILLDIYYKNGQINKPLIEEQKKTKTNLQSSLGSHLLKNYVYIQYEDNSHTSDSSKIESGPKEKKRKKIKNETEEDSGVDVTSSELVKLIKLFSNNPKVTIDLNKDEISSNSDVEEVDVAVPVIEIVSDDEKMGDNLIHSESYDLKIVSPVKDLLAKDDRVPLYNRKKMKPIGFVKTGKKKQKKSRPREPPTSKQDEDKFVRRYFNIKFINKPQRPTRKKYFCKYCPEKYNYVNDARDHVIIGCQRPSSDNNRPTEQHQPAPNAMSGQSTAWKELPGGSR